MMDASAGILHYTPGAKQKVNPKKKLLLLFSVLPLM
jgi:hypothetical protein